MITIYLRVRARLCFRHLLEHQILNVCPNPLNGYVFLIFEPIVKLVPVTCSVDEKEVVGLEIILRDAFGDPICQLPSTGTKFNYRWRILRMHKRKKKLKRGFFLLLILNQPAGGRCFLRDRESKNFVSNAWGHLVQKRGPSCDPQQLGGTGCSR